MRGKRGKPIERRREYYFENKIFLLKTASNLMMKILEPRSVVKRKAKAKQQQQHHQNTKTRLNSWAQAEDEETKEPRWNAQHTKGERERIQRISSLKKPSRSQSKHTHTHTQGHGRQGRWKAALRGGRIFQFSLSHSHFPLDPHLRFFHPFQWPAGRQQAMDDGEISLPFN